MHRDIPRKGGIIPPAAAVTTRFILRDGRLQLFEHSISRNSPETPVKLPSLNELARSTMQAARRFPFSLASALILAVLLWSLVDKASWVTAGQGFAAVLGIPLFMGIDLLAERTGKKTLRIVLSGLGVAGLVLFAILVGDSPERDITAIYRFGLLLLAAHLFVSVAPFLRVGSLYAFWEFNKSLFLRFLLSALFSGVLFGGLAVAMLAVDHLLLGGLKIQEQAYAKLFFVVGGLFNTLFFFAGVPKDFAQLEQEREYPKGLKIFAQNLLLPLVVLYMSILYVYAISILVKWEWPQGWIGWLVLSFSVLGILALLLLHPLQKRQDAGWIGRFARWFYVAVLPLIGLLFAAIMRRIGEYGITENRYFVLLLAVWLAGTALYFIFSKRRNIKVVPLSLCAAALLSAYGPWSAFSVSSASQSRRFHELAAKHSILTDGKIDPAKGERMEEEEKNEMRSIVYYLKERDELERIADVVPGGVDPDSAREILLGSLGLDYTGDLPAVAQGQDRAPFTYTFSGTYSPVDLGVKGFDVLLSSSESLGIWKEEEKEMFRHLRTADFDGREYILLLRPMNPELVVVHGGDTLVRFDVAAALAARIEEVQKKEDVVPADDEGAKQRDIVGATNGSDLIVEKSGGSVAGRLIITSVRGFYGTDSTASDAVAPAEIGVENLSFRLLLGGLPSDQ